MELERIVVILYGRLALSEKCRKKQRSKGFGTLNQNWGFFEN